MNHKFLFRRSIIILLACFLLANLSFRDSEDPRVVKIYQQLEAFSNRTQQQKIYLKTDKEKYMVGESIWLKAYVLKASNLQPDNTSNEVFVDLIGYDKEVYQNIIIRNIEGFANGDIAIADSIPEGNYQIVAYTNWMKNFDDEYFFSKTIQIVNPKYNNFITQPVFDNIKKRNKSFVEGAKEMTVQFFPEGGNLVSGISGRVAFKAINRLGNGVNVKGEIFDETNKKAGSFQSKHLGMGSFVFTPEAGRKYHARVTFDDASTKKIDLPAVEQKGFVLMANTIAGDQLRLSIQTNTINPMDEKSNEFFIVGQTGGEIKYISKAIYKGKPVNVVIPKKLFPAGISQITIFDYHTNPVCERLVFIFPKETENRTSMEVAKTNEGNDLIFKIQLRDKLGQTSAGNLSLSLSENVEINDFQTWNENIISNLLLTSDLKGKVENATQYFEETNPQSPVDLDLVMMINGWRRFIWKDILTGRFPVLLYTPSLGLRPGEVFSTSVKPFSPNISDKAFESVLNEQYDPKQIKKNTRGAQRSNTIASSRNPNVLTIDQNSSSYNDMVEYLKGRVAGVTVMADGIRIRGVNSINSGLDPLILQDGVEIGFSTLKTISPREVTSVEVLKGPDASIYGVRGANGVIILHMRKGGDSFDSNITAVNEPSFERMVSFSQAREFYVPAYDSWERKPSEFNVPRAVYWKPDIAVGSDGTAVIRVKNPVGVTKVKASIEGLASDGSVLLFQLTN